MGRKLCNIIGCLLLLAMTGCLQRTTPVPTTRPTPGIEERNAAVQISGVRSSSNTSITLYFSGPVSDAAQDPSLYKIFGPQRCDEHNWHAQLNVTKAVLDEGATVVTLTTAPQAGTTYHLFLSGMLDAHGSPIDSSAEEDLPLLFNGTAAAQAAQSDGDGVSDADEQVGWAVFTNSTHGTFCRDVNSDPTMDDTDGDGVEDGIERGYATDPRSPDTDGDYLSDKDEIFVFASSPLHTDTDEDSIADGIEATQLHTSPALLDTDGDGITDNQELACGGTNARLADLPELSLDLHGSPSIILNMTAKNESKTVKVETTLESDKEETANTDNSSTKMSIENTVKLHTEVKAGTGKKGWPPSASAQLTTDTEFKHGYFHETSSNWSKNSVMESQEKFESAHEQHNIISYNDGMLWVPMKIRNNSDLTFKIKDLRVIAHRMLPNGSFSSVGTLTPGAKTTVNDKDAWDPKPLCADPQDASTCGHILGPGGEVVLVMGADSLPAQEMKALVRDPSALMFEIGSYSLFQLDQWGVKETVNFAKMGESVTQRTGILVVDYSDGTVDRHMVSTNAQRNTDGTSKGVTLQAVFEDVLGITDYQLCADNKSLCRVKNAPTFRCSDKELPPELPADFCPPETRHGAKDPDGKELPPPKHIPQGFWMIAGTGSQFDRADSIDFQSTRLMHGERISLVYMLDSDGDGIYDREEALLGTDKKSPDTDGDGLDDYQESKVGWTVSVPGQVSYVVYPDPRFSDLDGDSLSDTEEYSQYTDPYLENTDGDKYSDSIDPDPINPPCMDPAALLMTAWWDGSGQVSQVKDIYGGDPQKGVFSDGSITGTAPADVLRSENRGKVFRFNLGDKIDNSLQIAVKDEGNHNSLHSNREFTLSTWVFWSGGEATFLSKGKQNSPTYTLRVQKDGRLVFNLHRSVHEKIWYCWVGEITCDDNIVRDKDYDHNEELKSANSIPEGTWTHVTVTFGGETMRIYVNGTKNAESSTTGTWWNGLFKHQTSTNSILSNNEPLLIGAGGTQPYKGLLDDIQFFTKALKPEEVTQTHTLGVCQPGK